MKRIVKYFPLALAAFALASCSSDDLYSNGDVQEQRGALNVEVAPLVDGEAVTRAANVPDAANPLSNPIDWQNGDQINVYDEDLSRFDEYAFQTKKFGLKNASQAKSNIKGTMTYALFPADRVDYHGWNPDEGAKAVITIPEKIVYNSATEYQTVDNKTAYVSNLPMFGTVKSGSTFGNVNVDLHWLTAVLRIQLNDAFANLSYLKIETDAEHPITGAFEALLEATTPEMQVGTGALTKGNVLYIDVRKVPAALSFIYVPVVAGSYQKFTVSTAALAGNENVEDPATIASWDVLRDLTVGFTFKTGSIYRISKAYDLTGVTTCELLSKALKQYQTVDGDANGKLSLNVGGTTGLTNNRNSDVDTDNTIWVPKMKASTLEINIPATTGISSTLAAGQANPIVIADLDASDAYDGTVIINTPKIAGTNAAFTVQVKMPKAKVVFAGADLTGTASLENTFQVDGAKAVVFGNGTTPTAINENATFNFINAETVTVAANAAIKPLIDVEETQNIKWVEVQEGGVANDIYVKEAKVFVTGEARNVVDSYSTGRTYIGYTAGDTPTPGVANGKIKHLMTFGDVYIANKEESEAITEALEPFANNNIYLLQGYVKAIAYNGASYPTSGTYQKPQALSTLPAADLAAKKVIVHLDNIFGKGLTAIETIGAMLETTIGGTTYNFIEFTESKWGGHAIDKTNFSSYASAAALAKIYTASELATELPTAAKVLYNDFDLNGSANTWTPLENNADFNGQDPRANYTETFHKIKNLKLANIDGITTYGLFKNVTPTANIEIKNFEINGITSTLNANNSLKIVGVGSVAGTVTNSTADQTVTFDNIKVTGTANALDVNPGTLQKSSYVTPDRGLAVGGIVGKAVLTTATTDALVIKNSAVTLNTIKGHAYVGGLVGQIVDLGAPRTAVVDLSVKNTVSVNTFSQLGQPTDEDLTYFQFGTFGIFVGTAQASELSVPFVGLTDATKAKLRGYTNKKALGFKYNHFTTGNVLYRVAGGCPEVGFSADMTATTPASTLDKLIVVNGTKKYSYSTANLAPKYIAVYPTETGNDTMDKLYPYNSETADANKRFNIYVKNNIWEDATKHIW